MLLGFPNEWTPRILFAAGEQGCWYDPSDITTLWQDHTRTTPVTAAGQTVGAIDDKSGNGNHATMDAASKKPRYEVDGTGRPYLRFDGIDDYLFTAPFDGLSTGVFTSAGVLKVAVGFTSRRVVFEYGLSSSPIGTWSLYSEGNIANTLGGRSRGTTDNREVYSAATITGGSLYVFSGYYSTAAPRAEIRSQGVSVGSVTSSQGPMDYNGPHSLFIGCRGHITFRARIDFYGGVIQFAASTSDAAIGLAERWLARKTGVAF